MRSDFRLMAALSKHTRVSPGDRIKKLLSFNRRLYSVPNVVQEFTNWRLELERNLVSIPARVLPCEVINFGDRIKSKVNNVADWTNDMKKKTLIKCGRLDDWVCLVPGKFRRETGVRFN